MSFYNNCHYWNSTIYKEWWYKDENKLIIYRKNAPSIIEYDEDGNIEKETWHNSKGQKHRKNKPAVISYYSNGDIEYEEYWLNDKLILK